MLNHILTTYWLTVYMIWMLYLWEMSVYVAYFKMIVWFIVNMS